MNDLLFSLVVVHPLGPLPLSPYPPVNKLGKNKSRKICMLGTITVLYIIYNIIN